MKPLSVSTRPVIRTVNFNLDGSMTWNGVQQPGSQWSFVQRGFMSVSKPGSVIQYKHTESAQVVFPALRVYRVANALRPGQWGWVLQSGLDTFTSFPRGGDAGKVLPDDSDDSDSDDVDAYGHEEADKPCIPSPTWRMGDLRRDVPKRDQASIGHDIDWLLEEADAFVSDYRRVLKFGMPARLQFGNVLDNQFLRHE